MGDLFDPSPGWGFLAQTKKQREDSTSVGFRLPMGEGEMEGPGESSSIVKVETIPGRQKASFQNFLALWSIKQSNTALIPTRRPGPIFHILGFTKTKQNQ